MQDQIYGFIVSLFWFVTLSLIGAIGYAVSQYNKIQAMSQAVLASHSNVTASMQKRLDLITKLMEVVSGYADHEKLTNIAVSPVAALSVSGKIANISKLAIQYPELRANQAYQGLMSQLTIVEDDLQKKRERHNEEVKAYNTKICQFPTNLFAARLGFKPTEFFSAEDADSLTKIKEFTSNDGEAVRALLSVATAKAISGSKQVTQAVAAKGRLIGRRHELPANREIMIGPQATGNLTVDASVQLSQPGLQQPPPSQYGQSPTSPAYGQPPPVPPSFSQSHQPDQGGADESGDEPPPSFVT